MGNKKLDCVLLVDDDFITNEINKRHIENSGIAKQIQLATDGQVALDYFLKEEVKITPPGLVLLDINMPRMNGWEFLEEYKKLNCNKKTTIVMLSSSINEDDKKKAEASQIVSEFIIKPLDESKIESIMQKYFYN